MRQTGVPGSDARHTFFVQILAGAESGDALWGATPYDLDK